MHSGVTALPGDGGVTIFFVVSGYIITRVLLREQSRTGRFDARGFYWRRALKLGPPFLVLVLLPTAAYALTSGGVSAVAVAAQTLFSYNWLEVARPDIATEVLPGTSVVWSLAVEEQFYIGFALIWFVSAKRRWPGRWIAGAAAAVTLGSFATRCLLVASSGDYAHIWHGTDTRIEAIGLGVVVAYVIRAHNDQGRLPWVANLGRDRTIVVAAVLMLLASLVLNGPMTEPMFRPSVHAWVAALVIAYASVPGSGPLRPLYERVVSNRTINMIGLASYSIYLVHFVAILQLESLLRDGSWLLVPLNVVVSVILGVLAYKLVEVPASRYRHLVGAAR
jgi:peptidoglycan/LPS O-acetylase OafA/YrhL